LAEQRFNQHFHFNCDSFLDFSSVAQDSASVCSSSSSSLHVPRPHPRWSDPHQAVCPSLPDSPEQLLPLDFDFQHFYTCDPTSADVSILVSASSGHSSVAPVVEDDLSFDLDQFITSQPGVPEIDVSAVVGGAALELFEENMLQPPPRPPTAGFLGQSASPLNDMSLIAVDMDRFTSSSTASSVVYDMANARSSGLMRTLALEHSHDHQSLAPKQAPSSSCSPTLHMPSLQSKKRPRAASSVAESGTVSNSNSNHSAEDSQDESVLEKRRRNTMAARRFRKRKQDHVSDLESQLAKVAKERDDLRLQVAKWEGEAMALRQLLERKG
jgi:hypothetical protein